MLTKPPIPYDFCICGPILHNFLWGMLPSSHTYDRAWTSNTLPMTKYRTATYTPMTFLWGVTDYLTRQLQVIVMFRMHTAHLANVSKSVTKNATFPRTGRLPCLITQQLHVSQLLGDSFSVTQRPPSRDACSHSSMLKPHF